MLSRSTSPAPLGPSAALFTRHETSGRGRSRRASRTPEDQPVVFRSHGVVSSSATVHRTLPVDQRPTQLRPETHETSGPDATAAPCQLGHSSQIVCAANRACVCPLAGRVSDAERAVMNDIFRQAARLRAVLFGLFVVASVVAMVALLLG